MRQRKVYVIGGLVFLLALAIAFWKEVLRADSFEVTFFDVGQGDAAFILTSQGQQIVIDGGPDSTILEKLAKTIPFWDKTIDMVILSHPAQDHVAGLLDVLQKYQVKTIMWTGIEKDTKIFQEWKKAIDKEQKEGATVSFTPLEIANSHGKKRIHAKNLEQRESLTGFTTGSKTVSFQEGLCPQRMDILFPLEDLKGTLVENDNDTSIVVRFASCSHSVLFTGDLTLKGERVLLQEHAPLDSDILKVGHHGSKTSSSEEFIAAVSPDIAVISSGKGNRYGHPHQETLETLGKYGIEIRRTDEEGDIVFKIKNQISKIKITD